MHLRFQIPTLNEAPTLQRVVEECLASGERLSCVREVSVLIVDDGSSDPTLEIARGLAERDPRIAVICNGVHRGLGWSFRRGLRHARGSDADVLVHVDGDGQFPLDHLARLLEPIVAGRADVVTASRFADPALRPRMCWSNQLGNRALAALLSLMCGRRFYDVSCGFRAFSRPVIDEMELLGDFTHTHETLMVCVHDGLRLAEVPLPVRGAREFGRSRLASNRLVYAWEAGRLIGKTWLRLASARGTH